MQRALAMVAALSLLLPGLAMAQQQQPPRQPGPPHGGGAPGHAPPGHPGGAPGRPPAGGHPGMAPGRPGAVPGRPAYYHPPVTIQPLPPRGGQYWHRGTYYGRIHGPAFAYPHGWGYRRWLIGQRFSPIFLTPAYFYPGWAALGLQAPPYGYAWVRFGPDLVLVNLATYEVEDVIYGVFY